MSVNGDLVGAAFIAKRAATRGSFYASLFPAGRVILTVPETQRLQLLLAKADGNAIDQGIQTALIAHPRIFVGTNPSPSPTAFKEGDIYLLREE